MENIKEVLASLNEPLIKENITLNNHKIFFKYTTEPYIKHIVETFRNLCDRCSCNTREKIFYSCLSYLLRILYNCKNDIRIDNFDLVLLSIFYISLKANDLQKKIPRISKLKTIYKEKYRNIDNIEIKKTEILCLKLLNYDINIITPYDCFYYLFKENEFLISQLLEILQKKYIKTIMEYVFLKPLDIATQCIEKFQKNTSIINNKTQISNILTNIDSHNESFSTCSSSGSGCYSKKINKKSSCDSFITKSESSKNTNKILNVLSQSLHKRKKTSIEHNLYESYNISLSSMSKKSLNNSVELRKNNNKKIETQTKSTFKQKDLIKLCNNINKFTNKSSAFNIKKAIDIKSIKTFNKAKIENKKYDSNKVSEKIDSLTKVFFRRNRVNNNVNKAKVKSLKVYMNEYINNK